MSPQHYTDGQADPDDPNDQSSVPFDWESLEHALGEAEQGPVEYQRLGFAVGRILRWLVSRKTGPEAEKPTVILRRLIALAWTVDPRMFDGSPSLRTLAKRYGVSVDCLSHHASETSKRFGIQNAYQRARGAKRKNVPTNLPSM